MKAKIKTERTDEGYVMIAVLPNGEIEYPQEGRPHKTRKSVFIDAEKMHSCGTWEYDAVKHTIKID